MMAMSENIYANVTINGNPVEFLPDGDGNPQLPVIIDGRTLVPVRAPFEAMGYTVDWDDGRQRIELSNGVYNVVIHIDATTFTVNGETVGLLAGYEGGTVYARIIGGRTMVPFRSLLESVGCIVSWNEVTRTVIVTTPDATVPASTTQTWRVIADPLNLRSNAGFTRPDGSDNRIGEVEYNTFVFAVTNGESPTPAGGHNWRNIYFYRGTERISGWVSMVHLEEIPEGTEGNRVINVPERDLAVNEPNINVAAQAWVVIASPMPAVVRESYRGDSREIGRLGYGTVVYAVEHQYPSDNYTGIPRMLVVNPDMSRPGWVAIRYLERYEEYNARTAVVNPPVVVTGSNTGGSYLSPYRMSNEVDNRNHLHLQNRVVTLTANSAYRYPQQYHHGIDLQATRARPPKYEVVPLYSIADEGEVIFNNNVSGYGHTVVILYTDSDIGPFHAQYSHLHKASNRAVRSFVNRGDIVGEEGNTPRTDDRFVHLHFAAYRVNASNIRTFRTHPPIVDVINPLTLFGITGARPEDINASRIFNTAPISNFTSERPFIDAFNRNPDRFANLTHQGRALNHPPIIRNMRTFFGLPT